MEKKYALIIGATGLIGKSLLEKLLNDSYYEKIYVLTRRPLSANHQKIHELVVDFDEFGEEAIPKVDDIYCCLGTTMKKAGSKYAFRKVDYHYPLKVAQIAYQKGAGQYLLVSSLGADKQSRFFYNQVKGEVEEAIAVVGFKTLHIFRPSILLGARSERRTGERIGQIMMRLIAPLLMGRLRKYRPIHASTVAEAMQGVAKKELSGPHIFESDNISILAATAE